MRFSWVRGRPLAVPSTHHRWAKKVWKGRSSGSCQEKEPEALLLEAALPLLCWFSVPTPDPPLALFLASALPPLLTRVPQTIELFADSSTPRSVSQKCKSAQGHLFCDLRWQEWERGQIPGPAQTPSNTGKSLYGKLIHQSRCSCP